jgi:D-lactate dehydrogenase (cytochrome)
MTDTVLDAGQLLQALSGVVGGENLLTGEAERLFYSSDLYGAGAPCAAVVRPRTRDELARAVGLATAAGYAVAPRGGGLTYVGGYPPQHERSIVVDVRGLNRIVEVAVEDMFITVEAGVTWKQIYEALRPHGLRLPFFGTFSGAEATVGGGLSNGALFLGTGRYGSAAEIVLGLQVALADGSLVRTGQASVEGGRPFFRAYGPDLTGLFVHDAGALGIKTEATLRCIHAPGFTDYLSYGFAEAEQAIAAASEVARREVIEEAYIMDPAKTRIALSGGDLGSDLKVLSKVVQQAGGVAGGLKAGLDLIRAGKHFADDVHSLNMVCAARNAAALQADMAEAAAICERFGGKALPNSIPKATRADLFAPINGALGPEGDRWVALNAKVAHSDGVRLYRAGEAVLARHAAALEQAGVKTSRLMTMMSNHAFSYEPVFNWLDSWLPIHHGVNPPGRPARFKGPADHPAARAAIAAVREELIALFADFGAASNQIGKTYRYLPALKPETRDLVRGLKRLVDPKGLMNPGALGL